MNLPRACLYYISIGYALVRNVLVFVSSWICAADIGAADIGAADPVDFERDIRPLLVLHCVQCHGDQKQLGGLRLDAKSFAMKGGDSGPVLIPNRSDASELLRRALSDDADEQMPPEGDRLSSHELRLLRSWIDEGANWQETNLDREATRDPRREHWAWQKRRSPAVPEVDPSIVPTSVLKNEIDHFVVAKLHERGLHHSPEADRRTLIRRLTYDLHGLPPSPEQVAEFESDPRDDAYEQLVTRLLDSPHYGERAAQHWLDTAHYADTHGFERDQVREHAWRYRDWVIRAFNSDMPYEKFLREQIAGDAIRPEDPSAVIATGFLSAGPWDFVGQAETPSPVLKRLARADDLDDMVTQVLSATIAVTINCARCHDHKLDPILQREYYEVCSVFAGVKRGNRPVSTIAEQQRVQRSEALRSEMAEVELQIRQQTSTSWSLADIAGGGNGFGTGKIESGIDPRSGNSIVEKQGFLDEAKVNRYQVSPLPIIDGVTIPDGQELGEVVISSSGLRAVNVEKTSGKAWDAIRNGAVNAQFSTKFGDIDFATGGHNLLSLHANAAITFDLSELPKLDKYPDALQGPLLLNGKVGYFGQIPREGANTAVWIDGKIAFRRTRFGRDDGLMGFEIAIPVGSRFLTLMVTDNGNDINHDQVCFVDAAIQPTSTIATDASPLDSQEEAKLVGLTQRLEALRAKLSELGESEQVYGVLTETPPKMAIHSRGNPEQLRDEVSPATITCLSEMPSFELPDSASDGERRMALANWIVDPQNPLTYRVIVNRLWQQHFGSAIVATPSDFGLGGSLPTHPELLDWLAGELRERNSSLKELNRLICCSHTYRQSSLIVAGNLAHQTGTLQDSSNRWLWRQSPRRLDAECIRDAVLATSGRMDRRMYGPGFRDFDYKEEYAPVYSYVTRDESEFARRSIYRFRVRTTPQPFLTTLDCPNLANLTPTRSVTTTALQSLAMLNHDFIFQQSGLFAGRLLANEKDIDNQIAMAWTYAFARKPTKEELSAAVSLAKSHGLPTFCRFLLNSNEFLYID